MMKDTTIVSTTLPTIEMGTPVTRRSSRRMITKTTRWRKDGTGGA